MKDQEIERIVQQMARTPLSRRGFMWASTMSASAAFLAACSGGGGQSAAPASTAPSAAPASTAPSAAAEASYAVPANIEKELFMYNWGDYVDPNNMKLFQQEFGVEKFTYDTFANNDEMMAKFQGGATGQWDICCPTMNYVPAMRDQGFIQKVDAAQIPNLKYINKAFKGQWWDPTDEWSVPKDWGTTGISIRTKDVKEEVKTWRQFLDLIPQYSGKVVFVDSADDVFIAPLKANGYSLNSDVKEELDKAREELLKVAPHILALDSDQYNAKIETEEAVLGLTWTGGILELRDKPETADTVYNIPEDGTVFWLDTWVVLAEAPHPVAAHAWINFVHEPQIQAIETETNQYATPNDAAKEFIDPKMLADPAIFVSDEVLAKLEPQKDNSGIKQRSDIWEEFKSKIGQG
ncbi:MAG TPA: spermidine/putrescine ABC transporter substrate-binding protein [Candidatus Limnocylindrales bacterium]|nr:spermidine/putrescine ABC transporter substrate-binding protein [Candidatus Limnocylindrales bacterium]